jgi:N-acetylmuramoyl-L-alanine amidase
MKNLALILSFWALILQGQLVAAAQPRQGKIAPGPTQVRGLQVWVTPEHTRLVLDTQGPAIHKLSSLSNPERLILDIENASLAGPLPTSLEKAPVVNALHSLTHNGQGLRLVLDLKRRVPAKTFMLPGNEFYGPRLVLDLEVRDESHQAGLSPTAGSGAPVVEALAPVPQVRGADTDPPAKAAKTAAADPPATNCPCPPAKSGAVKRSPAAADKPAAARRAVTADKVEPAPRELIIAIDAGHGGDDPGAIGPSGAQEKDVVLAIAKRLERMVNAEPGMRAVMIRKGDQFVGLRERIEKAHNAKANLFISIHADAFDDPDVGGSSVYTLSQRGASSEAARRLAEKENGADRVGSVELKGRDSELAKVLLDMAQSSAMQDSRRAAKQMLRKLKVLGKPHKSDVQYAGFAVLKAPDIPSLLVETAYISNPEEEAKLRDPAHQERLAEALLGGIQRHFHNTPLARATQVAQARGRQDTQSARSAGRRHVVGRGETLSEVAQQYRVSTSDLRLANHISGNRVRAGQVITIPEG